MTDLTGATKRLAALRHLPAGWNYGRGGPISQATLIRGTLLLEHLADRLGVQNFDVVPADSDGAVILAFSGNKSAEIICLPNGQCDLMHEDEDGFEEYGEKLSLEELTSTLERLGWDIREDSPVDLEEDQA